MKTHVHDFFRCCATPKITNYKLTFFCDFLGGGAHQRKKSEKNHGHVLSENTSIKKRFDYLYRWVPF